LSEALLIWGDTERSAHMFHALPVTILDPFLFIEKDGRRYAIQGPVEKPRILDVDPEVEVIDAEMYGRDALLVGGMSYDDADIEVAVRACKDLGITSAIVPRDFWTAVADRLRQVGIEVRVDAAAFEARRRVKTPRQLEGIRRAQAAADAAMAAAARLLRVMPQG
jgi:Xaa-Pro aminopeptidase